MSLQTTLARAESAAASTAWRDHKRQCAQCAQHSRRRNWDDLCDPGYSLWTAHRARLEELDESRAADKIPAPDQSPLF